MVPKSEPSPEILPQDILPSIFHLWLLQPKSSFYDAQGLDIIATLTGDSIVSTLVPFTEFGILTQEQISVTFTAILRMLEVPVSYVGSPYYSSSETVSIRNDKERKDTASRAMATFIIYSLCGELSLKQNGIIDQLDNLLHSIETFCHPSNFGSWTKSILNTVQMIIDTFILRWNSQKQENCTIPKARFLTDRLKDRFVLVMRNVVFLGIHSKNSQMVTVALNCLQGLAFLSPPLIIPNILKEVYPSLQGLVETHRTITSLKALTMLSRLITQNSRYAFHLTTLLSFAIPGIDANDLNKTLHSLMFIQQAALNAPFVDLSQSQGTGLAMEYVMNDSSRLEDDAILEDYSDEIIEQIFRSSTAAFGDFVMLFIQKLLALLENLPDTSTKTSRDSPENRVMNTIPSTIIAVMGALPQDLYCQVVDHVVDFIANNVINAATDTVAHICGCLVKASPQIAFAKLFPILCSNIKHEILENNAGSTRSGSEILPRDRALIWNLSILNMALANASSTILEFKDEITDISILLRSNCKGSIAFHIANTIHHVLMSLTTIYVYDSHILTDVNSIGLEQWGEIIDPHDLKMDWHVPSRSEVAFAVEFYRLHCKMSMDAVNQLVGSKEENTKAVTEFSDIMSSNLTYLRTSNSGISILFDTHYEKYSFEIKSSGESTPKDEQTMEVDEEDELDEEDDQVDQGDDDDADLLHIILGDEEGDDERGLEGEVEEMKKLREYPNGYFFESDERGKDPLYIELHSMRQDVGKFINKTFGYLSKYRESDISSFKALLYLFKVWISDIGSERTSKLLSSLLGLYSYDTKYYKIPGLRKEFPKAILIRRALVYHNERAHHNCGPRKMNKLEKVLLYNVVKVSMSIYPDIRRNAVVSLESSLKLLFKSKMIVYPWVLKEVQQAIEQADYIKATSGLKILNVRSIQSTVKRTSDRLIEYTKVLSMAMTVDYPQLNSLALTLFSNLGASMKLPLDIMQVDNTILELIKPGEITPFMADKISKSRDKHTVKRANAVRQMNELAQYLLENKYKAAAAHWKFEMTSVTLFMNLFSSPQMPVDEQVLVKLCSLTQDSHPIIKYISTLAAYKVFEKVFKLAQTDYNVNQYLLGFDFDTLHQPGSVYIDSSGDDFTAKFMNELTKDHRDAEYFANANVGWLVWPKKFLAFSNEYEPNKDLEFSENDLKIALKLKKQFDKEWLRQTISLNSVDRSNEEDDSLNVLDSIFLSCVLRIVELEADGMSLDEFLEIVEAKFDVQEKNSHRSTCELCIAILFSLRFSPNAHYAEKKLEFVTRLFSKVVSDYLNNDNIEYWRTVVYLGGSYVDLRRFWPIYQILNEFRLKSVRDADMTVFKDSSKISLLRKSIIASGWHYQHVDGILDNFFNNLNHPLQGIRDEIAKTLAMIFRTRYHESFQSVEMFVNMNKQSPLGVVSYKMPKQLVGRFGAAFDQLEQWRIEWQELKERSKNKEDNETSSYILGAKTLSVFLERLLKTSFGVSLVEFLPKTVIPALLHFLNVREEQEMMVSSVNLFNLLGNIAYPLESIGTMVETIVVVCTKADTWHQRMSILTFIQAFFFRQIFMMTMDERMTLVNSVKEMLQDVQLEVRLSAAETLAGLIRCSSAKEQEIIVKKLEQEFVAVLQKTRPGSQTSGHNVLRHSAVLGLGSLVQAFPYQSPPPSWVPRILSTLATISSSLDSGMIGKSVKTILGDFKKTRQDTWHIDSKSFTSDQLEDLEGVLWKNYFV